MTVLNNNDWKYYVIRFAFGIIALLIPITICLAAITYSNLRSDTKESFVELKQLIETKANQQQLVLTKQSEKLDIVCEKVAKHDTLLQLPYQQRKDFYTAPKWGAEK